MSPALSAAQIGVKIRERRLAARLRFLPYEDAVRTGRPAEDHRDLGLAWLARAFREKHSGATWSGWLPETAESRALILHAFRDAEASLPGAPPDAPSVSHALAAPGALEAEIGSRLPSGLTSGSRVAGGSHEVSHLARHAEAFLAAHVETGDARWLGASVGIAERLLRKFEISRRMPALLDGSWNRAAPRDSLTAVAHLTVFWFDLWRRTGDVRYANAALSATDLLCAHQVAGQGPLRGALGASYPLAAEPGIPFPVETTALLVRALARRTRALAALEPAGGSR